MRHTPALAVTAAVMLLTAACSSSQPQTSAEATTAATKAPKPAASASPEDASPALASCMIGTWQQDMEAARAQMEALMGPGGDAADAPSTTFSGTGSMTFEQGGALTSTVDSSTEISSAIEGVAVVMTVKVAGSTSATWSLDDSMLTIAGLDMSGLTTEITTTADGVEVEVPGTDDSTDLDDMVAQAPPAQADVSCTDDELTLSTETGVAGMEPVVQRYTR